MDAEFLKAKHDAGLSYADYIATGKPDQREAWEQIYNQVELTADQRKLVKNFQRPINVLVSSGIWCGDCVQQCPLMQRIAEANTDMVDLRFVDRDEHSDLAERIKVNGGLRVPVAIFMPEDYQFASMLGDRTLTRYRALADQQLGAACPMPGAPVPTEQLKATLQDWLNEFERVHLMLRLSARLRQKHGD